ncbi:MAG: sulfatase-like hydrolase/transferase, partial [Planctomycetia bacterium]
MATMKRFAAAALTVWITVGFGASWADGVEPRAKKPPNVVFLLADDMGWRDYGFMGHPHIETPRLDRLAAESLVFERGYVPSSLCRPSLASIITGLYPHQHGVTGNDPPIPDRLKKTPGKAASDPEYLAARRDMIGVFERTPNIAQMLTKHGYAAFQAGKWWEGNACRCGFTEGMTHGDPARGGRHGDEGLRIGREGLKPIEEFIDAAARAGTPFYVWYAPMMPHTPHNAPERFVAKYRTKTPSIHIARYWAACDWFDESCGLLLDRLDALKVADDTIVVYVCDNGWIQDPDEEKYAARSKRSPYDGGLRTPIMIRWPAAVTPRRSKELAQSIDLVPTVLHAVGVAPPANLPGIDLLDDAATAGRKTIFGAVFEHNAVDL